jgi:hypothetical protein
MPGRAQGRTFRICLAGNDWYSCHKGSQNLFDELQIEIEFLERAKHKSKLIANWR